MSGIEWEEPPAHILQRRSPGQYAYFAEELREHPKRWALLPGIETRSGKSAQATAGNIRRGKTASFLPQGAWEALSDVRSGKVWVRYVGEQGSVIPGEVVEKPAVPEAEERLAPLVRRWAQDQGMTVPLRGRLPGHLYAAYAAAQRPRVASVEVEPGEEA